MPSIFKDIFYFLRLVKTQGHRGAVKYIINKSYDQGEKVIETTNSHNKYHLPSLLETLKDVNYSDLEGYQSSTDSAIKISAVLPDFDKGSGGHLTFFRFLRVLNFYNVELTIWIYNGHQSHEQYMDKLYKYFIPLTSITFKTIKNNKQFQREAEGEWIFATNWISVYFVIQATRFNQRFYFLQDKEDLFTEYNHESLLAQYTFTFKDFIYLCAGDWLSEIPKSKNYSYTTFSLCADENYYQIIKKDLNNKKLKFFVMAQWRKPRRAVDLIWSLLSKLDQEGVDFEVHAAGHPIGQTTFPFKLIDYGTLTPNELCDLYNQCDFGFVFSATNYSLVPMEMMKAGLPVFEIKSESNKNIYPQGTIQLLSPNPNEGCQQVLDFIFDGDKIHDQIQKAYSYANSLNWSDTFENSLSSISQKTNIHLKRQSIPKIDICIPTLNGEKDLSQLIPKLLNQKNVQPIIHIIDSSSKDETINLIKKYNIDYRVIPQKEFQHGRTRNQLLEMCQTDTIVFLNQDSLPISEYFLHNYYHVLQSFKDKGFIAAFGPHIPYFHHNPFLKIDINQQMSDIKNQTQAFLKIKNYYLTKLTQEYSNFHFFSTNNCAFSADFIKQFKFPEVDFGEDQVLAKNFLEDGYGRIMINENSVYHSHSYSLDQRIERAMIDREFFKNHFGYKFENKLEFNKKEIKNLGKKFNINDKFIQDEISFYQNLSQKLNNQEIIK